MFDEERGELLMSYAEALWQTPDGAGDALQGLSRSWLEDAGDLSALAVLVSWLDSVLVPVRPTPGFEARLRRRLQRNGALGMTMTLWWPAVALAGSFVSVLGLAMLWRRRRLAQEGEHLETARQVDTAVMVIDIGLAKAYGSAGI